MSEQSDFEQQIAQLLVTALELEDVNAKEIVPTASLFGHDPEGLGLDSIDALEIALAINQRYGIQLRADDEANSRIFATLRSLAQYVEREVTEA